MNITEKYLEALKDCHDWVIISEWAVCVGEKYPDLLAKANLEAANQANETTGLREIAARISSAISRGAYSNSIDIDESERPRKVLFLTDENLRSMSNLKLMRIQPHSSAMLLFKMLSSHLLPKKAIALPNLKQFPDKLRNILALILRSITPRLCEIRVILEGTIRTICSYFSKHIMQ